MGGAIVGESVAYSSIRKPPTVDKVSLCAILMAGLMVFVIPQFDSLYKDFGAALPASRDFSSMFRGV